MVIVPVLVLMFPVVTVTISVNRKIRCATVDMSSKEHAREPGWRVDIDECTE